MWPLLIKLIKSFGTIFSFYILPLFDVMSVRHHIKENKMQVAPEKEGEEGCPLTKNAQKERIWAIFVKKVLGMEEEKERNRGPTKQETDTAQRKEGLKWGPRDLYKPPRVPWEGHCHTTRRASRAAMDPIKRLQLGERVREHQRPAAMGVPMSHLILLVIW